MNVLIVSAMTEEIEYIVNDFKLEPIGEINQKKIYIITRENNNIYIMNSGVGKVESSITLSMFLSAFEVEKIISIGTSGAINSQLEIGDFIVGDQLAYHDCDVTSFGYQLGQLPDLPLYFKPTNDTWWKKIIDQFKNSINSSLYYGTIVTGDQFVASSEQKKFIEDNFTNVYSCEMESTAICHTGLKHDKDVYVLRSVSDRADGQADTTFDQYLQEVCKQYSYLIKVICNE